MLFHTKQVMLDLLLTELMRQKDLVNDFIGLQQLARTLQEKSELETEIRDGHLSVSK